ncbi:hypothetical protein LINPERHAP1_LOCUS4210 [Linum perenne]
MKLYLQDKFGLSCRNQSHRLLAF